MIKGIPRKFIRIQLTKTFLTPQPKGWSEQSQKLAFTCPVLIHLSPLYVFSHLPLRPILYILYVPTRTPG